MARPGRFENWVRWRHERLFRRRMIRQMWGRMVTK